MRIIHIDPDRRRMGLSIKQVEGYEDWLHHKQEDEAPGETESTATAPPDVEEEPEEEPTVEEA